MNIFFVEASPDISERIQVAEEMPDIRGRIQPADGFIVSADLFLLRKQPLQPAR